MASTGSTQHLVIRKKDSVVMTDTDKPSMSVSKVQQMQLQVLGLIGEWKANVQYGLS